jgi:hypothetical protein
MIKVHHNNSIAPGSLRPLSRLEDFLIGQSTQLLQTYAMPVWVKHFDVESLGSGQPQNMLVRRTCVGALIHGLVNSLARCYDELHRLMTVKKASCAVLSRSFASEVKARILR